MLFDKITPEQAGIKSSSVKKFLDLVKRRDIPLHSLIMMKGDSIFCECYWEPYNVNSNHRMYSQTKSYVSVAIGLLEQEGKLCLQDKIADYFPDMIEKPLSEHLQALTIEEMLTMTTAGFTPSWFSNDCVSRTHFYFNSEKIASRPSGTLWGYDSAGSQVLSSLVERLSGKSLFDYLNEKVFSHLGTFKNAEILKARNEDSWGDSALLCSTRDMASFARFVMNYGKWNGKQLLNEAYLKKATSPLVSNKHRYRTYAFEHGYGYQIWCTERGGFAFVGMGDQLTVCLPDDDLIFVCTADCQNDENIAREQMMNYFFDLIVYDKSPSALPENPKEYNELESLSSSLKLFSISGNATSPFKDEINGKTYICEENTMGISELTFVFGDDNTGELKYVNAQGEKTLKFGINHNEFGKFPQLGYSNDHGGMRTTDGFMYDDAVSMTWLDDHRIMIYVQIIDRYLGNVVMNFAFKDDMVAIEMIKVAEDFLNEYHGDAVARRK